MVEVQLLAGENMATILALVVVALEDVVARQLQLLAGQLVEKRQQDDARQAQVVQSEEVRRLKAELRRVTEERDILKKAAAYFAKQSG